MITLVIILIFVALCLYFYKKEPLIRKIRRRFGWYIKNGNFYLLDNYLHTHTTIDDYYLAKKHPTIKSTLELKFLIMKDIMFKNYTSDYLNERLFKRKRKLYNKLKTKII